MLKDAMAATSIDVSAGQTDRRNARPVYGRMYPDAVRRPDPPGSRHIATMAVGAITSADQVNTIVAAARADLVALARPHLLDPYFTMRSAGWYGAEDIHCPPQYLSGRDQLFRNSVRERAEMTELKLKAKPKPQIDTWKQAAE
jgi:anthraniloyl-CoA monooxygenase